MSSKWVSTRNGQTKDASNPTATSGRASRKKPSISNERFLSRLMECEIKTHKGRARSAQSILNEIQDQYSVSPEQNIKLINSRAQSFGAQDKFEESLEAIKSIEKEKAFQEAEIETQIAIEIQKATSTSKTGDSDQAIKQLKETLRRVLDQESEHLLGAVYIAFSEVYGVQRDLKASYSYAEKGLDNFRDSGDWRGMVKAYYLMARAKLAEKEHKKSLDYFELATKIAKEESAPVLMGGVYSDRSLSHMALSQSKEAVFWGEKAVGLLSKTEDKTVAMIAKTNLSANLIVVGDWARAEELLLESLEFAAQANHPYLSKIYNSLGELKFFQGRLDEARELLEKGVEFADKNENEISQIENALTMTSVFVAEGSIEEAIEEADEIIKCCKILAEEDLEIHARLILAEAYLTSEKLGKTKSELDAIEAGISKNSFAITGKNQLLLGRLAAATDDSKTAIHSFRRALTIFETREDLYHSALTHYLLGQILILLRIDLINARPEYRNRSSVVFKGYFVSQGIDSIG